MNVGVKIKKRMYRLEREKDSGGRRKREKEPRESRRVREGTSTTTASPLPFPLSPTFPPINGLPAPNQYPGNETTHFAIVSSALAQASNTLRRSCSANRPRHPPYPLEAQILQYGAIEAIVHVFEIESEWFGARLLGDVVSR